MKYLWIKKAVTQNDNHTAKKPCRMTVVALASIMKRQPTTKLRVCSLRFLNASAPKPPTTSKPSALPTSAQADHRHTRWNCQV